MGLAYLLALILGALHRCCATAEQSDIMKRLLYDPAYNLGLQETEVQSQYAGQGGNQPLL